MTHHGGGRAAGDIVAGIALIAALPIAIVLKALDGGWVLAYVVFFPHIFLPAWALMWVIAFTGFFSRRRTFRHVRAGAFRAQTATWTQFTAFVVVALIVPDAGDDGIVWNPFSPDLGGAAVRILSNAVFLGLLPLALAATLWLIVEWILALRARARHAAVAHDMHV